MENASLQTNLERNHSNSYFIFFLVVNFENLTIRLHVFMVFFILAKFQGNKKSVVISSIAYLNFKFLW